MMESSTILLAVVMIFGLGLSAFFDKLAVGTLGIKTGLTVYVIVCTMFIAYFFLSGKAFGGWNITGLQFAIISGLLSGIGTIAFYLMIQKEQVSLVSPFVSLYPAITVILGLIFLHEKIKLVNAAGIVLALIAGVLLAL